MQQHSRNKWDDDQSGCLILSSFLHSQAVSAMQPQPPVQPAASPVALETHPLNLAPPVPPTDPMARKQVVQDLMAQMQGTYNFMQVRTCRLEHILH